MWNLEIMEKLLNAGFELKDGKLIRNRGSISHYDKVKIHQPRIMTSMDEKREVPVCYVDYEALVECGYFEVDREASMHMYIEESKLVDIFVTKELKLWEI